MTHATLASVWRRTEREICPDFHQLAFSHSSGKIRTQQQWAWREADVSNRNNRAWWWLYTEVQGVGAPQNVEVSGLSTGVNRRLFHFQFLSCFSFANLKKGKPKVFLNCLVILNFLWIIYLPVVICSIIIQRMLVMPKSFFKKEKRISRRYVKVLKYIEDFQNIK